MNGCVLETRVEFRDNFRNWLIMSACNSYKESFSGPCLTVCLKTGKGKGCPPRFTQQTETGKSFYCSFKGRIIGQAVTEAA